ncbi:MAG: aminotransferase class I/II-fold pyridoxal phosphate-dependent enzyme [Pseudomonas sp.]|nr:aminotransferase class I/II-fold pyridoxal phosphate-dependent enzyme [Pseudomonas sp.]
MAAAIRPNTKLISINFPHNPTGKILERERFDALVMAMGFYDNPLKGLETNNGLVLVFDARTGKTPCLDNCRQCRPAHELQALGFWQRCLFEPCR